MDSVKQDLDLQSGISRTEPHVAVWMVTYNHELFIAQAIDSVLMQKTNFEFHLFIGEDCSTDNTSNICKYYTEKHPNKITLFAHEQNIGATNNAKIIYKACFESDAKYVAMLEGDDYWTDPYKLQKQVDFLEVNLDYTLHTHGYQILNSQNEIREIRMEIQNKSLSFSELLNKWDIQTATFLLRAEALKGYQNNNYKAGDISLVYHLSEKGKIYCSSEVMSVYRVQGQGVTNMDLGKRIEFLESMNYLFLKIINSSKRLDTKKGAKRLYVGNLLNLSDHYRVNKQNKKSFVMLIKYLILRNISMSKMELRLSIGIIKNYFYA